MRVRLSLIIAVVLAACVGSSTLDAKSGSKSSSHSHHKAKGPSQSGEKGEFDYYLMALSWSPSFCETHPDVEEQCQHKGYGFVLHGLWPQYDGGGGPENCATTDEVDKKTIEHTLAFMPSRSLITHEWRTHGACSGMSPEDYFAIADRAFAAVHVPRRAQCARKAGYDDARCAARFVQAGQSGSHRRHDEPALQSRRARRSARLS